MSIPEKAMDMATKAGEFIAPLVKGTLEEGIGIFEDKLKYIRWERQIRLMERADSFMKARGIQVENPIPLKLAIPLLEGAALEDDDDLQDRWAKLIVNSVRADGVELKRVYIDILERLSPLEAKILDVIYQLPFEKHLHSRLKTFELPEKISVMADGEHGEPQLTNEEVELALVNLARLGCIASTKTLGGGELFSVVNMTLLGHKFYKACTLEDTEENGQHRQ